VALFDAGVLDVRTSSLSDSVSSFASNRIAWPCSVSWRSKVTRSTSADEYSLCPDEPVVGRIA
jgi:hypothetical protein